MSAPASLPFRLEYMGDPAQPYIVHDLGRHDQPFDPHTMRSYFVPHDVRPQIEQLWNALLAAERRAVEAQQAHGGLATQHLELREAAGIPAFVSHDVAVVDLRALLAAATAAGHTAPGAAALGVVTHDTSPPKPAKGKAKAKAGS